eukprot:10574316-Lingulodinium_polyedra.AAC.1
MRRGRAQSLARRDHRTTRARSGGRDSSSPRRGPKSTRLSSRTLDGRPRAIRITTMLGYGASAPAI